MSCDRANGSTTKVHASCHIPACPSVSLAHTRAHFHRQQLQHLQHCRQQRLRRLQHQLQRRRGRSPSVLVLPRCDASRRDDARLPTTHSAFTVFNPARHHYVYEGSFNIQDSSRGTPVKMRERPAPQLSRSCLILKVEKGETQVSRVSPAHGVGCTLSSDALVMVLERFSRTPDGSSPAPQPQLISPRPGGLWR